MTQKDKQARLAFFMLLGFFVTLFVGFQVRGYLEYQARQDQFVCEYSRGYNCD